MAVNIGIDLGTVNVVICTDKGKIILNEPSIVAIDEKKEILAIGKEAKCMVGKTPKKIKIIRPLRKGVIATFSITEIMLKYFMTKVVKKQFTNQKPVVALCVPTGVTSIEKYAVENVAREIGAREVLIIEEPIAAAIGAGIDIEVPLGRMVLDIGGGTSDVAVISYGSTVVGESIQVAGDNFTEDIKRFMKKDRSILIGDRTAEVIKIQAGNANENIATRYLEIKGRNLITGLPERTVISSDEIRKCMEGNVDEIINLCKSVLEKIDPELAGDIYSTGIILTGGGGLLEGLDEKISNEIGVKVIRVAEPLECVCKGLGKILKNRRKKRGRSYE